MVRRFPKQRSPICFRSRAICRARAAQAKSEWERWPAALLAGKTVGILGVGLIAEYLAPICKSFHMTVVGISGSPREANGFDRVVHRDALEKLAPELDFLVALTPLTAETRGIVGAKVLAAMKPTAYLVNVARGGVVDEPALIAALESGQIAGAALDVFAQEPLPANSPLWKTKNVTIFSISVAIRRATRSVRCRPSPATWPSSCLAI